MLHPRGKKPPSQYHQARHGTTLQQHTDDRLPENLLFNPQQYTNIREVDDDTVSVEDVVDDESIPDAFKRRKRVQSSHIWLSKNGIEHTTPDGVTCWKCQRCNGFHSMRTRNCADTNRGSRLTVRIKDGEILHEDYEEYDYTSEDKA